ncbi:4Fe-4S dicluster domain-containing protein [Sporomusa sphaeroides]|uniref:2-oxoglutarate-acceptor oxidoreductase subunit OorD n=2 Tax=Sporomusa TaxID=2375 RepID=A0ABP2CCV5_9FIRM|nr:4Fe-4S binding protein [Sporomusa sphaeroides]OLS54913.1 NAD(P)H-quinone oxidoreductase subunit I, chloroplastic [Sporomusa sphaeroides DSM 2875]CVK21204.1 2-oxoglutarate-acceptor oxidoreductase subunit OorD [Sporomusa sphaeroides DSM 2875]SCM83758.1 4fe-4S ferredoxin, iron-sulfur binding domain protein [uncultured Sporomusa sp.]
MPRPVFNSQKCKACELCVSVCPKKILELSAVFNSKGYLAAHCLNDDDCIGCAICARMCPDTVIEIFKD